MLFCGLIKGISPKICILCVRAKINKRSFEPFCVSIHGNRAKYMVEINKTLKIIITHFRWWRGTSAAIKGSKFLIIVHSTSQNSTTWRSDRAFHQSEQYHMAVRPCIPPVRTVPHGGQIVHSTSQHTTTWRSDHSRELTKGRMRMISELLQSQMPNSPKFLLAFACLSFAKYNGHSSKRLWGHLILMKSEFV